MAFCWGGQDGVAVALGVGPDMLFVWQVTLRSGRELGDSRVTSPPGHLLCLSAHFLFSLLLSLLGHPR